MLDLRYRFMMGDLRVTPRLQSGAEHDPSVEQRGMITITSVGFIKHVNTYLRFESCFHFGWGVSSICGV